MKTNTAFAQLVIQAASDNIPNLEVGIIYSSRQVLGTHFWGTLTPITRKRAGLIVASAVRNSHLPLSIGERQSDNKQTYFLPKPP